MPEITIDDHESLHVARDGETIRLEHRRHGMFGARTTAVTLTADTVVDLVDALVAAAITAAPGTVSARFARLRQMGGRRG